MKDQGQKPKKDPRKKGTGNSEIAWPKLASPRTKRWLSSGPKDWGFCGGFCGGMAGGGMASAMAGVVSFASTRKASESIGKRTGWKLGTGPILGYAQVRLTDSGKSNAKAPVTGGLRLCLGLAWLMFPRGGMQDELAASRPKH